MAVPTKDHQINGYTVTTKYCTTCRQEGRLPKQRCPAQCHAPRVGGHVWRCHPVRTDRAGLQRPVPLLPTAVQPLPPAALLTLRRVRQLRGQV